MATKNFSHSGRVLSLEGRKVRIGFESRGACAGCKASSKCGMVDSSTREVEVEIAENESYNIGDVVKVAISYQMGIISVVVAYIIPLIILLSTLALAVSFGVNEGVAALVSLGMMVIYFIVVYLLRSKLDKQIIFTIEK